MLDAKVIEELASRISSVLANPPARDIEKNLRALLAAALARMDLVTREEFEIQRELLDRARQRLAELEARVTELKVGADRNPGASGN
jgi:BMFP domain-containing protein YqiC